MIRAFAPAKVNLALHVTGQRPDGYHLLDSLVVFADIGDRLTVARSASRSLSVTGPFAAGVPTGPDNLIWKAADLLDPSGTAAITLEKNLPHGAGIGGGSSDAAAALTSLAALWDIPMPPAAQVLGLGADVPVCLAGRPARMQGIGEHITPVPVLPDMALVLANPGLPMPTPAVFAAMARRGNPGLGDPHWTGAAGFLHWLQDQRNDMEAAAAAIDPGAAVPARLLAGLEGCQLARMSGSGATAFGLFDTLAEAETAAATLRIGQPSWWVVAARMLG